ncbi:hypothetical protein GS501_04260 [Saccharibacter sp. 17.LH.SD]|uniref:Rap1a/Tai family immunity protein n=1 Tax=Saccharibacter sp. 17.LH.SD TaxID=2689393 RepID=UPI0013715B74|nr:Rap1a/Tai family immunity protein [Saccharibacter sp. 17.LH.SD]MXV44264.1 hypothetical protein [Saccharibacter sp. 17.LH.SD]
MKKMTRVGMLAVVGLGVLSLGQAAQAQRDSSITGKALGAMCTQKNGVKMCDAYLSGVIDGEAYSHEYGELLHDNTPVAFCVPDGQKMLQIRNVVVAWLAAHTDALSQPAGKGVYRALHENYPCGSTLKTASPAAPSGGSK